MTVAELIATLSRFDPNMRVAVPGTGPREDEDVTPTSIAKKTRYFDEEWPDVFSNRKTGSEEKEIEAVIIE